MYSASGGGACKPESVISPASGAGLYAGLLADSVVGVIGIILLIRVHQFIDHAMQSLAHLRL